MIVKLLTEHHLGFQLKGRLQRQSESTLVEMSNCWESHAAVQKMSDREGTCMMICKLVTF